MGATAVARRFVSCVLVTGASFIGQKLRCCCPGVNQGMGWGRVMNHGRYFGATGD